MDMERKSHKFPREEAEKVITEVKEILKGYTFEVCGSYRRGNDEISDLDILAIEKAKGFDISKLKGYQIEWSGEKRIGFEIGKIHVDIKFVPKESWGAGLLHHTGPWGFNIKLRSLAKKKGLILNEYGLFNRENPEEVIAQKTELEVLMSLMNETSARKFLDPSLRKTPSWLENKKK